MTGPMQQQSPYPPSQAPTYPPPGAGQYPPAGPGFGQTQFNSYAPAYQYQPACGPAYSSPAGAVGGGYPPNPNHGNPFSPLLPSIFPPGTDPNVIACFQAADRDGSGFIDNKELQGALSTYNQKFSVRTVHLLMFLFTGTNVYRIGPKEFTSIFYSLQNWKQIFERFDMDRSGKIDVNELREALASLGLSVSPMVLDLLISKFDKTGGMCRAIEYDNFIECCLTVKGLTDKFKEKDTIFSGNATFTYDSFMFTVLPFLIA